MTLDSEAVSVAAGWCGLCERRWMWRRFRDAKERLQMRHMNSVGVGLIVEGVPVGRESSACGRVPGATVDWAAGGDDR
jgi:hypothetical protein